jgi:hypothetical protein
MIPRCCWHRWVKVHCPRSTAHCLLSTAHWPVSIAQCSQPTINCPLSAARYPPSLSTVHCPVSTALYCISVALTESVSTKCKSKLFFTSSRLVEKARGEDRGQWALDIGWPRNFDIQFREIQNFCEIQHKFREILILGFCKILQQSFMNFHLW